MSPAAVLLAPLLVLAGGPGAAEGGFGDFAEPALPYLASTVDARRLGPLSPADNLTVRGVCLKPGPGTYACFDTDLLRLSIAWQGGFLSEKGIAPLSYKNPRTKASLGQDDLPRPLGEPLFGNGLHPGCVPAGRPIADPRPPAPDPKEPGRGPLPAEVGRWQGLYLHGAGATLAYSLHGAAVHEQLAAVPSGLARLLRFGAVRAPCRLVLAQLPPGARVAQASATHLVIEAGDARLVVRTEQAPPGWALAVEEGRHVTLALQRRAAPATLRITLQRAPAAGPLPPAPAAARPLALARFDRGGPARFAGEVITRGRLDAAVAGGYAVDDLPLPEPNPWRRRVRLSGIAFFRDGRAAVATIDGDIWIVRGLDEGLGKLRWRRFAAGLHEPQSVVVRDGELFTFTRDGIVRLHDLDGDGEADFYENFSNLPAQTAETREFPMDMVLRPDGGFYLAKGGQTRNSQGKHNGTIVAISRDGRKMEIVATGLRQPYLGIHPVTGLLTASDQQGNYVPSTPVHVVRPGGFYGFKEPDPAAHTPPVTEPICWIPHHVAGSGAGQVWVTGRRMGPLAGRLLYLEYSRGALLQVFPDGEQGAVHALPIPFPGALLKGAMSPADQALYLVGFQLWGSHAQRLSGFFRLRHTGRPDPSPVDVRSEARGVLLRFSQPLDPEAATAAERYAIRRWNYRRSASYGSGFFRLDGEPGQELLPVHDVRLSADRRSVFLRVPDVRPAMQMEVAYRLRTAGGQELEDHVYLTVAAPVRRPELDSEFPDLDAPLAAAAAPALAIAATPRTVEAGRAVAERLGCISCHSTDGTTDGRNGPTWKGLFRARRRLSDGTEVIADEAYLRESIYDPARRVLQEFAGKDVGMPSYLGIIDDGQVEALILFIRSLGGPDGSRGGR